MLFVSSSQLSSADAHQLGTNVVASVRRERRRRGTPHQLLLAAVNRSLAVHGEAVDRFNAKRRVAVA